MPEEAEVDIDEEVKKCIAHFTSRDPDDIEMNWQLVEELGVDTDMERIALAAGIMSWFGALGMDFDGVLLHPIELKRRKTVQGVSDWVGRWGSWPDS